MVSKSYLVGHERPPSAWLRNFNQRLLPIAINGAGCGEAALERFAQTTRRQPVAMLGLTFAAGLLLAGWPGRRRSPANPVRFRR